MPKIRGDSIPEHRELVRSEVISTAAAHFYSRGYADSSLVDIADAVGVGRTTLYEYFPSKAALLVAVIEDQVPRHVAWILEALPKDQGAVGWIDQLFEKSLSFAAGNAELAALVFREGPQLIDRMPVVLAARLDDLERGVEAAVARGVAAGELRDDVDASALVRLVVAALLRAMETVTASKTPRLEAERRCGSWLPLLESALVAHA